MNDLVKFFKSKYLYICILLYLMGDFFLEGPLKNMGLFSHIYLYFGKISFVIGGLLFINIVFSFGRTPPKNDVFSINIEFIMLGFLSALYFLLMLKIEVPFTREIASDEILQKAINITTFEHDCGQVPSFLFYLILSKFPNLHAYILLGVIFGVSIIVVFLIPVTKKLINLYRQENLENQRESDEERETIEKELAEKEEKIILGESGGKIEQNWTHAKTNIKNIRLSMEEIEELTKQAISCDSQNSKMNAGDKKSTQSYFINNTRKTATSKETKSKTTSKIPKETSTKTIKLDAFFENYKKSNDLIGKETIFIKNDGKAEIDRKIGEMKIDKEDEKKSTFIPKNESIISEGSKNENYDIFEIKFKEGEEILKTIKEAQEKVRNGPKDIYSSVGDDMTVATGKNSKIISLREYLNVNEKSNNNITNSIIETEKIKKK